MMIPKRRITRTIEEIGAYIPANREASADIHAEEGAGGLYACLEGGDVVVVCDEVDDVGVRGLRGGLRVDVAADAAGVVAIRSSFWYVSCDHVMGNGMWCYALFQWSVSDAVAFGGREAACASYFVGVAV
jgi:hypothetical protein